MSMKKIQQLEAEGERPFDPAALGFERIPGHSVYGSSVWRKDEWDILIDESSPGFKCWIRYWRGSVIYMGDVPESHCFAVALFRHLGLEIEQ